MDNPIRSHNLTTTMHQLAMMDNIYHRRHHHTKIKHLLLNRNNRTTIITIKQLNLKLSNTTRQPLLNPTHNHNKATATVARNN
jgi:hypothetical protein